MPWGSRRSAAQQKYSVNTENQNPFKMKWADIKSNGSIEVCGVTYSLEHLQDASHKLDIPATEKYPVLSIELLVQYSCHCFTCGPKRNETIDFGKFGEDSRVIDDRNIHRRFDLERYTLSKLLPGVFAGFVDRTCYFTGHENWLTIEIIPAGAAEPFQYQVFFNVRKQSKSFLRVYIESAYVRTDEEIKDATQGFKRGKVVRARTLLAKTLRGEKIQQPF